MVTLGNKQVASSYRDDSQYGYLTLEYIYIYSRMQSLDMPQQDAAVRRLLDLQGFTVNKKTMTESGIPPPNNSVA